VQNRLFSTLLPKNVKIKIYRNIILPVVYGWSLTLREEGRLRVFENRVLRRIFGPKRDEVTSEWRELHNEELNNLYSSPDIVCRSIYIYIYIYIYTRLYTTIITVLCNYKLISTWLHVSAAHAAIFSPANRASTLMCAQYWIPN
jgi:hypothetical protein